jgi:integrase/recombinase XerD
MVRKKKKKLLSKRTIREIVGRYTDPEIKALAAMAEQHRQAVRSARKPKKRKQKTHLRPTDYLSAEQFAAIMQVVISESDTARSRTNHITRAAVNEMLVILMAETGLRAAEVCNLRLKDLPSYHGKQEIEVISGKGDKDRTIGISLYLKDRLCDYVSLYHKHHALEGWLFRSEQGSRLKYRSIYAKIKRIGFKAKIWLYRKDGKLKSRLSPHKFRHTYATLLLHVSDNEFLVQNQLGHEKPDTTQIYARTLSEKLRAVMNNFHDRLFAEIQQNGKSKSG